MRHALIGFLLAASLIQPARAGFGNAVVIAGAATTVAVNSRTIVGWFRHPNKTRKAAVKGVKDVVKGRS